MRPAGLAVIESELLRSAVERALAGDELRPIVESSGFSRHTVVQQLVGDRSLKAAAGHHAATVYTLAVRRETLAERVREEHDPERAYYLGGRPRPQPADLIGDRIKPVVRMVFLGPARGLWAAASDWGTAPRVLFRSALVFVVLPAVAAVLAAALVWSPGVVLAGLSTCVVALVLACAAGLVQRRHHRAVGRNEVSLPVWLERRTAAGFEANLQRLVEADPLVQESMRLEVAARNRAEHDLVQSHVLAAAIQVLGQLSEPPPVALGPGAVDPTFGTARSPRRRRPQEATRIARGEATGPMGPRRGGPGG